MLDTESATKTDTNSRSRKAQITTTPKKSRRIVVGLLGLALLGGGLAGGFALGRNSDKSSGSNVGAAGTQMADTFRAQLTGDYDTYWDHLYPGQQKKIDKKVFIKCVTQPALKEVPQVRALDEFSQTVNLGVPETAAKVVTVQFKAPSGTSTRVAYTVLSGSTWRWLLGENELNAYASGKCS